MVDLCEAFFSGCFGFGLIYVFGLPVGLLVLILVVGFCFVLLWVVVVWFWFVRCVDIVWCYACGLFVVSDLGFGADLEA